MTHRPASQAGEPWGGADTVFEEVLRANRHRLRWSLAQRETQGPWCGRTGGVQAPATREPKEYFPRCPGTHPRPGRGRNLPTARGKPVAGPASQTRLDTRWNRQKVISAGLSVPVLVTEIATTRVKTALGCKSCLCCGSRPGCWQIANTLLRPDTQQELVHLKLIGGGPPWAWVVGGQRNKVLSVTLRGSQSGKRVGSAFSLMVSRWKVLLRFQTATDNSGELGQLRQGAQRSLSKRLKSK